MSKKNFNFIFSIIFLSLINNIFGIVENFENVSKYDKNEYLEIFKIPNSLILSPKKEVKNNRGIFKKFISFISNNIVSLSSELTNKIELSFKKKISFNRIIMKIDSDDECKKIGNQNKVKIYYRKTSENDFIIKENFSIKSSGDKIILLMNENIECEELKLELKESEKCENKIKEEDILLLSQETEYINENIINAFDKRDYRMLTLSDEFKNKEIIENLESDLKKYELSDNTNNYIRRIKAVYNGDISYDPRREFTTNQKADANIIYQRGNIDQYARQTLKMTFAGTNRQSTGIYGRSNETITVFVKKGDEKDPLPSIRFTQYIGYWANWLGKVNNLKEGEQSFIFDDFKITESYTIDTFPGGPIYLINPYTSKEQSQNITIYIEGGELFPIFKLNGNEEEYKNGLLECIKLNQQDKNKYFDITELISLRTIITVKASEAYKKYYGEKKSPQDNLNGWDSYIKKLFIYDGIQFEKDQPFYNENNNYVNLHIRFSQPYGGAYAYTEHIGIFYDDWIDLAINFVEKEIGWGFPHEIGHTMDIGERVVSETSNNMISKYSETYLQGDGTWGPDRQENKIKYLTPDNIDDILRGCQSEDELDCKGFLMNMELNYLVFWDIESLYHGYWGKIDNMYRYNNTISTKLSKEEKFVYFSNIILGMDLGYYFTRWGLSFSNGNNIFDETKTSSEYKELMKKAINDKLIDTTIKKKFWYFDYKEYNYMNDIALGCYKDKDEYDIQITSITNPSTNQYTLSLPKIKCPGHLGFEIYEGDQVIGFTYDNTYTDKTIYQIGYTPKYKIVAYDRLLDTSKESNYKSFKSNLALKQINNNNILDNEE